MLHAYHIHGIMLVPLLESYHSMSLHEDHMVHNHCHVPTSWVPIQILNSFT